MTNSFEHQPGHTDSAEVQGEGFLHSEAKEEYSPTIDEQFLELLSLPYEKIDELRAQFQEITRRALSTTINPHDQESIMITANIVHWRMFGEPGDPLPYGLAQGYADDGSLSILYDTRTGFNYKCADAAADKLDAVGLNKISSSLEALLNERSEQIKEAFTNIIEASQAFKFINTLVSGELPQQPEELPLTPFWRAIRETQINQTVRMRWGLEPQEQIIPHTEPDYDLRRAFLRLDDETAPMLAKPESDPFARLRSYLGGLVQAEFTESYPNEIFAGFAKTDSEGRVIRTVQNPKGYNYESDWIQNAARKLSLQINKSDPHVQLITEEWLYYLTVNILWPNEEFQDFKQYSQSAIDEAWDQLEVDMWYVRSFSYDDYRLQKSKDSILHAGLVTPSSAYINLSELGEDRYDNHEHYGSAQSRAEINSPYDERIGELLQYTPNVRGQYACRLIQSEPKQDDLPLLRGDEELVIRLFGKEFEHAQPYIPGYCLVSNTQDVYGFILDETGDPYASADILLTPD